MTANNSNGWFDALKSGGQIIKNIGDIVKVIRKPKGRRTTTLLYGEQYSRMFFSNLIQDINEHARTSGIDVMHLCATGPRLDSSLQSMMQNPPSIDGIMILPTTFSQTDKSCIYQFINEMKRPALIFDRRENFQQPYHAKCSYHCFDNSEAARIISTKLTNVTFVRQIPVVSADEQTRLDAFPNARQMSLPSINPRDGAFEAFLTEDLGANGDVNIVCMNDDLAVGVDDALFARAVMGQQVGRVRVWSYDCCAAVEDRIGNPSRSFNGGVRQDTKKLAGNGIESLKAMMDGGAAAGECRHSPSWHASMMKPVELIGDYPT